MDAATALLSSLAPVTPEPQETAAPPPADPKTSWLEQEHRKRMPPGYKASAASALTFDPRLAFELALGMDSPEEVLQRYNLTHEQFTELAKNPAFQQCLKAYAAEIQEKGLTFQLKARVAAEDLLTHAYAIAVNEGVSPAVRADLIKWHAKVAGLEPKNDTTGGHTGEGFSLQIVFSGQPGQTVTGAHQPLTIEGERA